MIDTQVTLSFETEEHRDFECPICQDSGWLEIIEENEAGIRLVRCICHLPTWGQDDYHLLSLEYLDYHPLV